MWFYGKQFIGRYFLLDVFKLENFDRLGFGLMLRKVHCTWKGRFEKTCVLGVTFLLVCWRLNFFEKSFSMDTSNDFGKPCMIRHTSSYVRVPVFHKNTRILGDVRKQTIMFHPISGYVQISLIETASSFKLWSFFSYAFEENGSSIKLHFSIIGSAQNKTEHSSLSDKKIPWPNSSQHLTDHHVQRPQFWWYILSLWLLIKDGWLWNVEFNQHFLWI